MIRRITHYLKQGTPEWHEFRATHNGASDAPAMMGKSPYKTRSEFMHELATGEKKELDWHAKKRLDNGHAIEEQAKSDTVEVILGEEVYPCVMSYGKESASLDGITMDGKVIVEVKTLNNRIRGCDSALDLPIDYRIQMQQQLYVSGAERCLFVAESGTESMVMWYDGEDGLMDKILANWREFEKDLSTYKPAKPDDESVTEIASLPVVEVSVTGSIQCQDNMDKVKAAIESFMANDLIRSPVDDSDFANLDNQIKALKRVEDGLAKAESAMLSQVDSVAKIKAGMDELKALVRNSRLAAEKIVRSEKERRRNEALKSASNELFEFAHDSVPLMPLDFFDLSPAIKGLKTMASIKDKLATAVASKRIEIQDAIARRKVIMEWAEAEYPGKSFLLPDIDALLRNGHDVKSIMAKRVEDHLASEAKAVDLDALGEVPDDIASWNSSDCRPPESRAVIPDSIPLELMALVMRCLPQISKEDARGFYEIIADYFNKK